MKIDGLGIADLPVMSSANQDDLLLIVQNNALKLQSYNNLTGTFSAISGSFKVDGIALPKVDASSVPPTDELVLIVENNGLAVKQVGIGAPSMPVGSFIDVDGVQIPSIRFSGNIDGDELCVAIRNNNTCLIPIPLSFSVGALPTSGRLLFAPLKSSLVLSAGTGSPTFTRATKAWRLSELGLLDEIPSGCAVFSGSRFVWNYVQTKSEDFTGWSDNAGFTRPSANVLVSTNATTAHAVSQNTVAPPAVADRKYFFRYRVQYVDSRYAQLCCNGSGFGTSKFCTFDLVAGSYNATNVVAGMTAVSSGVWDIWVKATATATVTVGMGCALALVNSLTDTRFQAFVGDGVKSINPLRADFCDITGYDASYIPEYVSVGVASAPFFGAGVDGAKYYETDWQGAPIPAANLLGFRKEAAATNNLPHCRDLSNAAWSTKTNITAAKTATGLDGMANTATSLTATASDAIILQPITLSSAARCASAYVKRRTGTGTIYFTQDGGSTWTDITSQINSSAYSRVQITSTLANPSVGFKISTSGDAIDVDVVQNEAGSVATSPIITTTATVTRNTDVLFYPTAGNIDFATGTLYGEAQFSDAVVTRRIAVVGSDGFSYSNSFDSYTVWRAYDGTNIVQQTGLSDITTAVRKRVVAWGSGTMKVTGDGLAPASGSFDGSFGGASTIDIAQGGIGYIRNLAIYNYKMTDAELQGITA